MNDRRVLPADDTQTVALRPRYDSSDPHELHMPVQARVEHAAPPENENDWWQVFRRRKTSVLVCVLIFGVAAVVLTKTQTPIYQSQATLEYLQPGDLPSALRDSAAGANGSDASLEASMQTYASLIQHEGTLSKVIARLKLEQNPDFLKDPASPLWVRWSPAAAAEPPNVRALKIAARDLGVSAKARIIRLTFDSSDPMLAANFLNTLTDEFMKENSDKRKDAARRAAEVLYNEAAQLRTKLNGTDAQLQAAVRGLGDTGTGRANPAEDRLHDLSSELARAEADRIQKQSQRQVVSSASPDSIAEATNDGPAREYMVRLTDLRRQLAEKSAILTPAHPQVQQIQSQIEVYEKALQTELARIRGRVENDYRSAEERERMLSDTYLQKSRLASDAAARSVSLDRLRHEAEADWNAYAAAFQKARELSLSAITPATDVRIVDDAEPASRPYRPSLWLNLVLALSAGFIVGLAQAVVRTRADSRLHSPGEAALLFGFPELAAVPIANRRTGSLLSVDSRVKALPSGTPQLAELAQHTPDMMSDSFRQAAASLCLQHDIRSRVIVVTSPGPGEGKTTIVSNLAATLVHLGNRVLLIDGDLRRPRVHQLFQVPNNLGLVNLLLEPADRESGDGFGADGIRQTLVPGLFLLTSGTTGMNGTSDTASLLCSRRMKSLIRRVRHEFDIVLIDAPPALLGADARLLARLADGVVLVVRSGDTRRDTAQAALDRLIQDRANVLGYILNGWDANAESSYYSSVYHHYQASAS